ncbi:MAG: branched-chain amino acid ABC transporter permease [Deltaproteobacteria bacterium]|nr:branched-chain amino acid ABC transporter permease [Deltaproteobacteria bacterium]
MRIGDYQESYAADEALFRTPTQRVWLMAAGAAAVVFPFLAGDYLLYLANLVGLLAIGALGLNILTGFTGQISLGHAGFMGVGAYTVAIAATRLSLPFWIAVPLGGAAACLAGAVVGVPSLRIKGLYLAISTLAAQVIFEWVFGNWTDLTGGIRGINVAPATFLGFAFDSDRRIYFLIHGLAALHAYGAANLFRTRVGRAFVAVRDRDLSAELMGVNLFRTKILAFMVSSYYAGIAGGMWVYFTKVVTPENFPLSLSIQFLAMIIVGGLGSVQGTLLGTVFITLVPEGLKVLTQAVRPFAPDAMSYLFPLRDILFGAMIVAFLIFEPHGLAEVWRRIRRFFALWPFPK